MGYMFAYVSHKSNSLIPSMMYHFIHDAFIYLVQVPGGDYYGLYENLIFFISMWMMLGIMYFIVNFVTKNWNIKNNEILYDLNKLNQKKSS